MLAEALRKVADVICPTEICANNFDAPKKAWIPAYQNLNHGDRDPGPWKKRLQLEAIDPWFTTDARSILMEVRGHPMLRRPPPMTAPPKSQNAQKYCEFHE